MARQNGQLTWVSPIANAALGDDASSTSTRRIFVATERVTVVEVGVMITNSSAGPNASFAFTASIRTGGDSTTDAIIPVFTAPFAAEGGVAGDPSTLNFDNAHAITNGIITNTLSLTPFTGFGASDLPCLRAYCEASLNKSDQLVFKVTTGGGASSVCAFYAKAYLNGAGIVEACDVDSN